MTASDNVKHAGATILPATATGSQFANAAVLIWPASEGALLGRGKCTASSAGLPESNGKKSEQWARRHTDNITWDHD
ncbi:hypothetical protein CEP52_017229 [Fusarium oligoseptatum]|uniref:Uncharacterized protein n=1 Tax=Fusarium oligoseptatum TaxID=2604345 RepID=A0A428RUP6_9HYPO|nr:hypothetical protein CEP52_017229 [Fusarium oligoseptatum]